MVSLEESEHNLFSFLLGLDGGMLNIAICIIDDDNILCITARFIYGRISAQGIGLLTVIVKYGIHNRHIFYTINYIQQCA